MPKLPLPRTLTNWKSSYPYLRNFGLVLIGGSQRAGTDESEPLDVALLLPLLPTTAVPALFPVRPSLSESVDSPSSAEDVEPPDVVSSRPRDVDCEILVAFFDVDDDSDLTDVGGDLLLLPN